MSYILDALKKAERERQVAKIPTVDTVHGTPWEGRRPHWVWIGTAIVLVNAALLLVWFLRPGPMAEKLPRSAATPPASAPAAIDRPPAPPQDKPAITSPGRVATAAPPPLPFPPQASTSRPPPETTTRRPETTPSPPLAVAPVTPRTEPGRAPVPEGPARPAAAAPEKPVLATPAPRVPPPAVVPEKAPSPPAAQSPATPGERNTGPAPGLQELTPAEQEGIPKMSLQLLVYSEIPAERLVFINNQKYVEGQSIEGKVLVEGILPDGAILSYQGRRFKIRQ